MPRQAMLRPVKSAESLVTAANVQRSQSERRTSKTEAGLEAAAAAALAASLLDDQDLSSSNELLDNKSLMESSDDLCPLETVSKAVACSNVMRDSPRTHARSNSHDSYFERKLQRQLKNSSNGSEEKTCENDEASSSATSKKRRVRNNKMDSSLDLSEIQVNFDLEENEMKIFSEDEAMMTNSFDSGEDDFTRSPLEEEGHQGK